jgi:hypothetical protein
MDKEFLLDLINNNPLVLLAIKDKNSIDFINNQLPYSVGIEIECNSLDNFNESIFKKIPDIMAVACDSGEKRFRIPNGLKGIICLYNICQELPKYCSLNTGSGIHYHIDCTETCKKLHNRQVIKRNNDWIISDLTRWETAIDTKSSYAKCDLLRCWCHFSTEFYTIEIRIGEMTFDYNTMIKRILDGNRIVKKLKQIELGEDFVTEHLKNHFQDIDVSKILLYLKVSNLSQLDQSEIKIETMRSAVKELEKNLKAFDIVSTYYSTATITIKSRVKKFI